jgi:uroporphyrin-III C-methyltransferase/precorrin-2 dehydrogenase/sirohydrochlorin ferrochelatase
MKLFPLFTDVAGKSVLLVGGGGVAERKAALLLEAGAQVELVARELTDALRAQVAAGRLRHGAREFAETQLDRCWLVIAATDDAALNAQVAAAAAARRIFVNVVDDAALSSFQVPAIVDRAPLTIAISSGGSAPMLSRLARERIETLFDHSWGALAALLARARERIRARYANLGERRAFYTQVLRGEVATLVAQQREAEAEKALEGLLRSEQRPLTPALSPDDGAVRGEGAVTTPRSPHPSAVGPAPSDDSRRPTTLSPAPGHVTLVGAGPGDPGLLTLNALRALNEADVILHDRLVSAAVLELARRDAERIDVGKVVGKHHFSQADINAEMVRHARAGKRVVRVKGGDPFIFGRGGEEIEYLRAHGIEYTIVPGITAAIACAAYAGIPLTHRDRAQVVRFATAHRKRSEGEPDALTAGGETLAIYMGVAEFANVRDKLYSEGVSAGTHFAIVENGTRPEQRVLTGTLAELVECANAYQVKAPSLLIVGDVAQLAETQHWFGAPALTRSLR